MKKLTRNHIEWIGIAVMVIVHIVGFVGINFGNREWFLALTPVNLLLSAVIVSAAHRGAIGKLALLFAVTFLVGFGVEVLGVHTGAIFGIYEYGPTLGPKMWEVPLMIGVNWFVLVYATGMLAKNIRVHWAGQAAIGALLMTGLDYFIEPVAIQLDFWTWGGDGHPPIQNFIAWFVVALLLHLLFSQLKFQKSNKVAVSLFIIQLLFFASFKWV